MWRKISMFRHFMSFSCRVCQYKLCLEVEKKIDPVTGIQEVAITLDPFVQRILGISLAFTMLSVALGLKPADFAFIRSHPRTVMIGSVIQLIALPVMTLGIVWVFEPSPGIALGMLIVASCPGGNVSNLLTRIAKGDTAYSVSLTLVSSIFSGIALPFAILFWTGLYTPTANLLDTIDLDRAAFLLTTTATLVLPLMIGLLTAHSNPDLADRLHRRLLPVAVAILVGLIVTGLISNHALILGYGLTILPIVIFHNAAAYLLGNVSGRLLLEPKKARALTFEVGIQNAGLGLIIVLAQFGGVGSAAVIVGTWSIWHIFAGFLLANSFRFLDKKHAQQAAQ